MNPIMLTLLYFTLLYFTYWNEIVIWYQVDSLKKTGRAGLGWIPRVNESHYACLLYLLTSLYFTYWNEIVIWYQVDSLKKTGRAGLDPKS